MVTKDLEAILRNKDLRNKLFEKTEDIKTEPIVRKDNIEYDKIDFFLSTENKESEKLNLIVQSLKDPKRRKSMLNWLQDKFASSYDIAKIQDIWDNCRPDDRSWVPFTPARDHWKLLHWEAVGAHQWQIKADSTWDEAGDPSDVALQVYENGWIVMARTATDVRGFRVWSMARR